MNAIQLDQECDAVHLVKACAAEGKVSALRFPRQMRGMKDPEVLDALVPNRIPIVTLDRGFVVDHIGNVPDYHAGFLVLAYDDNVVKTISTHGAQQMLATLKADVPQWDSLDLSNSVIDVRNSMVEVCHCESHVIVRDVLVMRSDLGWQAKLQQTLAINAARNLLAG